MTARSALKFSTALFTFGAALSALPAHAQEAGQAVDVGEAIEVEELVVTGTFLRRKSQAGSPTPITVVGQEDLLDIGAADIADLINTLPINNGAENFNDAFTQNLNRGTESINLRGLGVSSTLVLLNNKRQVVSAAPTDSGLNFVDTASLVPLIAIERVEILEGGASAIYGTDAVAGVVNFITRNQFEGLELRADFQTNAGGASQSDYLIQGIWGGATDRGNLVLAASYLDRSPLTTREQDLRPAAFAGPGGLSVAGSTGQPGNFILGALPGAFAPEQLAFASQAGATQYLPFALPGPDGAPLIDPSSGLPFTTFDPVTGLPVPAGTPGGLVLAGGGVENPGVVAVNSAFNAISAESQFPDPGCLAAAEFEDDIVPNNITDVANPNGTTVTAGQCEYDFNPFFNLVPEETRILGYAHFDYEITDSLQFFGEFSYARNRIESQASNFPTTTPFTILGPGTSLIGEEARNPATGLLPAVNPFNPTFQDILLLARAPGSNQVDDFFTQEPNPNTFDHNTFRTLAGLRGDITDSWGFEVSYLRAINDFLLTSSDGLATQTNLALVGLGGEDCNPLVGIPGVGACQFYNPFATGSLAPEGAVAPIFQADGTPVIDPLTGQQAVAPVRNSAEVLDFITGDITLDGDSDITVVDAVVGGDLFRLFADVPIFMEAGFQFRAERLAQDLDDETNNGNFIFVSAPVSDFDNSRDSFAGFVKLDVPITNELQLEAAVRYEDIELAGDTVDPTIALRYQPLEWLSVRGSWGTSFRAPSLFQQFGSQTTLVSVVDPVPGGGQPFIAVNTSGNEDLEPEESTAYNAGFTVEPIEGLEFSLDYFRFEFENIILQQSPESVALTAIPADVPLADVAANPFLATIPGVVERGPTGSLTFIATQYVNTAFLNTDGLDFAVNYTRDTDFGLFRFGIQGTWVNEYEAPIGVDGATVDLVDRRNSLNFFAPVPDLRFNANINYVNGPHSGVVFVRYIDSFLDDQNCGGNIIDDGELTQADFADAALVGDGFSTCAGVGPDGEDLDFFEIDSFVTVDMQYTYNLEPIGFLQGASFSVGATNVFDNLPPFINSDGGFETRTHDPRGRQFYVRLRANF